MLTGRSWLLVLADQRSGCPSLPPGGLDVAACSCRHSPQEERENERGRGGCCSSCCRLAIGDRRSGLAASLVVAWPQEMRKGEKEREAESDQDEVGWPPFIRGMGVAGPWR